MNKRFFLAVFLFLIAIGIVSYGRSYTAPMNAEKLTDENITLIKNIE